MLNLQLISTTAMAAGKVAAGTGFSLLLAKLFGNAGQDMFFIVSGSLAGAFVGLHWHDVSPARKAVFAVFMAVLSGLVGSYALSATIGVSAYLVAPVIGAVMVSPRDNLNYMLQLKSNLFRSANDGGGPKPPEGGANGS